MRRGGWPEHPAIYEIYPRSFRDTTGSGEGDLRGVLEGLDHVASLGVDAIWLAPFYDSPMVDGGYDIRDHCAVDPRFGTLDDFDAVLARAHQLGLKVMTDLVFNHTSDRHPWFEAALLGDDAAAARYVFRDARPDGGPPTNWLSFFGEPAWTWCPARKQYYLRQFLACQPSLDLRHPEVQAELERIVHFWRDRGVDGFRFDAVTSFLFDPDLPDNPPASAEVRARMAVGPDNPYSFQDHLGDMLPGDGAAFAEKLRDWSGPDAWLIGEINSGNRSVELTAEFTAPDRLDAGYTVDLFVNEITAARVAEIIARKEAAGCGLAWCLSCHDHPRAISRSGDGSARDAKLLALLSAALPGALILWQGEELGQKQAELARDEIADPYDRLFWPVAPGRDGARVPFPWQAGTEGHGFTTGTPWLPMRDLADVALDAQGPDGVLAFWRRALALRRDLPGDCAVKVDREVLTILRGDVAFTLNFGQAAAAFAPGPVILASGPVEGGKLPPRTGVACRMSRGQE